jgi:hypothetical protein
MDNSVGDRAVAVGNAAHKRLDRIEAKIDKLTDFMIAIARVEEKQAADSEEIKCILRRMEIADEKADRVDSRLDQTEVKVSLISRVFWAVIISVVVGTLGYHGVN